VALKAISGRRPVRKWGFSHRTPLTRIIDLARGRKVLEETGHLAISFNGEIFNCDELRESLRTMSNDVEQRGFCRSSIRRVRYNIDAKTVAIMSQI
jgi:asparagine synthetase B (glutamine-hydrolysing)